MAQLQHSHWILQVQTPIPTMFLCLLLAFDCCMCWCPRKILPDTAQKQTTENQFLWVDILRPSGAGIMKCPASLYHRRNNIRRSYYYFTKISMCLEKYFSLSLYCNLSRFLYLYEATILNAPAFSWLLQRLGLFCCVSWDIWFSPDMNCWHNSSFPKSFC